MGICCHSSKTDQPEMVISNLNENFRNFKLSKTKFESTYSEISKIFNKYSYLKDIQVYNITDKEIKNLTDYFLLEISSTQEKNLYTTENLQKAIWFYALDKFLNQKLTLNNLLDFICLYLINKIKITSSEQENSAKNYLEKLFEIDCINKNQFGLYAKLSEKNSENFVNAKMENLKFNSRFDTEFRAFILTKEDLTYKDNLIIKSLSESIEFSKNLKTLVIALSINFENNIPEDNLNINALTPLLKGIANNKSGIKILAIAPLLKINLPLFEENQKLIIEIILKQKNLTLLGIPFLGFDETYFSKFIEGISVNKKLRSFLYGYNNLPQGDFNLFYALFRGSGSNLTSGEFVLSSQAEKNEKMNFLKESGESNIKIDPRVKFFIVSHHYYDL
jgi:hypothetical protein